MGSAVSHKFSMSRLERRSFSSIPLLNNVPVIFQKFHTKKTSSQPKPSIWVNLDYKFEGIGIGTQSHRYQYPGVVSSRLVDHWCLMFSPSLEVISVMSKNEAQRNTLGSMVGKVSNTCMTQR